MALNIVFVLLIATFMYSAAQVNIKVSATRATYTIEGNYLVTSIPVSVENHGFYPIENIKVWVVIENGSREIWRQSFIIGEIGPLHTYVKNFVLRINLINLYEKLGRGFALHGGQLKTRVMINAGYWILANVQVNYVRISWWTPFIKEFKIDAKNITITDGKIVIPYLFKPAFKINGKISMIVKDANRIIASGNSTIVCGEVAKMYLNLMHNPTNLKEKWEIIATIHIGHMELTNIAYYNFIPEINEF